MQKKREGVTELQSSSCDIMKPLKLVKTSHRLYQKLQIICWHMQSVTGRVPLIPGLQ